MNTVTTLEPILVFETSEPTRESVPAASPKTRKPRVWTVFATLIVAAIVGQLAIIAGVVALGVVTGFIMGAQGADGLAIEARLQEIGQQPLLVLLFSLIPFQFGMAVVVLIAARRSKEPLKQRLGLVPQTGRTLGRFKLATMAAFTMSIAYASVIVSSLFIGLPPTDNPISAVITDGSWWTITLLSIILSVIPALVEESLFRGYLQRRFLQRWSPAVAISVSTLLFAVMHMDSPQHIIAVVPLGVVTGLLAYRTNSVKPGMLVHAIHNTGVVGFAALATVLTPHFGQEELGLLFIGVIGLLGLIGLPAVVSLLRSAKPSVATDTSPEPAVESPSVLSRELKLPSFASDSQLASAV
jgi:membrane protease YdiL (CAAX protease family)